MHCLKEMDFVARNRSSKYGKQLLDTGLDALKTASQKAVHKAAETIDEFIGNKIADKIVKLHANSENAEEIIIPPAKMEEILNDHHKIMKLLNDSTILKFVTGKRIELNDCQVVNILPGKI